MNDLGATVPCVLKSCNIRRTNRALGFDWLTFIVISMEKISTIKFIRQFTTDHDIITLIPEDFLLNMLTIVGKWSINIKSICLSRVAICTVNNLHHLSLHGWWWCLKEYHWQIKWRYLQNCSAEQQLPILKAVGDVIQKKGYPTMFKQCYGKKWLSLTVFSYYSYY